jgi:hypothetical protein
MTATYQAIIDLMAVTEVEFVAPDEVEPWFLEGRENVSEFIELEDFADDPESEEDMDSDNENAESVTNCPKRKRGRSPSPVWSAEATAVAEAIEAYAHGHNVDGEEVQWWRTDCDSD